MLGTRLNLRAAVAAALMGFAGIGGSMPRRSFARPSQWHNPARVEAAEAKRTMRREKVLRAVAAGGYRSATWTPSP